MHVVHVSFCSMQLQDMKQVYILEESLLVVMFKFYCLPCHLPQPQLQDWLTYQLDDQLVVEKEEK